VPELQALLATPDQSTVSFLLGRTCCWTKYFCLCLLTLLCFLCHRGASILKLVETRRARERLFSKSTSNIFGCWSCRVYTVLKTSSQILMLLVY
jgi:hypothetical protein